METELLKNFPSLITSLSSATAAVLVTLFFLRHLKEANIEQTKLLSEFKIYHTESQKKFQDQIDRLADRQEETQDRFQVEMTRLASQQNEVIHESIMALKEMKITVRSLESIVKKVIEIDIRRKTDLQIDIQQLPPSD